METYSEQPLRVDLDGWLATCVQTALYSGRQNEENFGERCSEINTPLRVSLIRQRCCFISMTLIIGVETNGMSPLCHFARNQVLFCRAFNSSVERALGQSTLL
jgi:hypothetical protein